VIATDRASNYIPFQDLEQMSNRRSQEEVKEL